MFYPEEIVEEIRLGNDIVHVVSNYVHLKQKGSAMFGLCPFHNEKTPSFSVAEDKQMYYCFGCGATGNVYTFIMQMENMTFPNAIQFLADKINFRLPEQTLSKELEKEAKFREKVFEINKKTARFFYDNLLSEVGITAEEYLDKRIISKKSRRIFGIGYAKKDRNALFKYLKEFGYNAEDIEKAGLIITNKKGGYFDRFFDRLMFPIFDISGRVVGFGGRSIDGSMPKYINSSETLVFNKSQNLYGINFARLSKKREFFLVEGYMDVISLHQAGFTNTVAALGTAFNSGHSKLLKRYADSVVILFDQDDAGIKATLRAIPILLKAGLKVKTLTLEDAKDPDEYIEKFGSKAFENISLKTESHVLFQVNCLKKKYNLEDTDEKVKFTIELAEIIACLDNAIERDAYAKLISDLTDIDKVAINTQINNLTDNSLDNVKTTRKQNLAYIGQNKMKEKGLYETKKNLLYLMCFNAKLTLAIQPFLEVSEMNDPVYEKLLTFIYNLHEKGLDINPANLLNYFETVEEQTKISDVFNTVRDLYDDDTMEKAVNDLVRNIKKTNISKRIELFGTLGTDADEIKNLMEMRKNLEKLYITI